MNDQIFRGIDQPGIDQPEHVEGPENDGNHR